MEKNESMGFALAEKTPAVKLAFFATYFIGNYGHGCTHIDADTYTLKLINVGRHGGPPYPEVKDR
jgi:hypothetical protein